jgi:iron-sulfur cluster assembly accessory protein
MIDVSDSAINQLLKKDVKFIRLGVKGGGCAGYEYYIEDTTSYINMSDKLENYGKFTVVVDEMSVPFLSGSTLDWVQDGLNEFFKIINPKEESSCGCGVSIQFNEDLVSKS